VTGNVLFWAERCSGGGEFYLDLSIRVRILLVNGYSREARVETNTLSSDSTDCCLYTWISAELKYVRAWLSSGIMSDSSVVRRELARCWRDDADDIKYRNEKISKFGGRLFEIGILRRFSSLVFLGKDTPFPHEIWWREEAVEGEDRFIKDENEKCRRFGVFARLSFSRTRTLSELKAMMYWIKPLVLCWPLSGIDWDKFGDVILPEELWDLEDMEQLLEHANGLRTAEDDRQLCLRLDTIPSLFPTKRESLTTDNREKAEEKERLRRKLDKRAILEGVLEEQELVEIRRREQAMSIPLPTVGRSFAVKNLEELSHLGWEISYSECLRGRELLNARRIVVSSVLEYGSTLYETEDLFSSMLSPNGGRVESTPEGKIERGGQCVPIILQLLRDPKVVGSGVAGGGTIPLAIIPEDVVMEGKSALEVAASSDKSRFWYGLVGRSGWLAYRDHLVWEEARGSSLLSPYAREAFWPSGAVFVYPAFGPPVFVHYGKNAGIRQESAAEQRFRMIREAATENRLACLSTKGLILREFGTIERYEREAGRETMYKEGRGIISRLIELSGSVGFMPLSDENGFSKYLPSWRLEPIFCGLRMSEVDGMVHRRSLRADYSAHEKRLIPNLANIANEFGQNLIDCYHLRHEERWVTRMKLLSGICDRDEVVFEEGDLAACMKPKAWDKVIETIKRGRKFNLERQSRNELGVKVDEANLLRNLDDDEQECVWRDKDRGFGDRSALDCSRSNSLEEEREIRIKVFRELSDPTLLFTFSRGPSGMVDRWSYLHKFLSDFIEDCGPLIYRLIHCEKVVVAEQQTNQMFGILLPHAIDVQQHKDGEVVFRKDTPCLVEEMISWSRRFGGKESYTQSAILELLCKQGYGEKVDTLPSWMPRRLDQYGITVEKAGRVELSTLSNASKTEDDVYDRAIGYMVGSGAASGWDSFVHHFVGAELRDEMLRDVVSTLNMYTPLAETFKALGLDAIYGWWYLLCGDDFFDESGRGSDAAVVFAALFGMYFGKVMLSLFSLLCWICVYSLALFLRQYQYTSSYTGGGPRPRRLGQIIYEGAGKNLRKAAYLRARGRFPNLHPLWLLIIGHMGLI
jgi:hypothetical protein